MMISTFSYSSFLYSKESILNSFLIFKSRMNSFNIETNNEHYIVSIEFKDGNQSDNEKAFTCLICEEELKKYLSDKFHSLSTIIINKAFSPINK